MAIIKNVRRIKMFSNIFISKLPWSIRKQSKWDRDSDNISEKLLGSTLQAKKQTNNSYKC